MDGKDDLSVTSEVLLEELRRIMKTYQNNCFPGLDSHRKPSSGIQIHISPYVQCYFLAQYQCLANWDPPFHIVHHTVIMKIFLIMRLS